MRNIVLDLTMSLDGFIEGPNGELDWIAVDDETFDGLIDFIDSVDTVLYGRVSYDLWGAYAPSPDSPEAERRFYDALHQKTKYVFSNSRQQVDGTATVLTGDLAAQVQTLKQQPGKDIWLYGGAKLITSFVNLGLVDKYHIAVQPVVLGAGTPLFTGIAERHRLTLTGTQRYASGVVALHYRSRVEDR